MSSGSGLARRGSDVVMKEVTGGIELMVLPRGYISSITRVGSSSSSTSTAPSIPPPSPTTALTLESSIRAGSRLVPSASKTESEIELLQKLAVKKARVEMGRRESARELAADLERRLGMKARTVKRLPVPQFRARSFHTDQRVSRVLTQYPFAAISFSDDTQLLKAAYADGVIRDVRLSSLHPKSISHVGRYFADHPEHRPRWMGDQPFVGIRRPVGVEVESDDEEVVMQPARKKRRVGNGNAIASGSGGGNGRDRDGDRAVGRKDKGKGKENVPIGEDSVIDVDAMEWE